MRVIDRDGTRIVHGWQRARGSFAGPALAVVQRGRRRCWPLVWLIPVAAVVLPALAQPRVGSVMAETEVRLLWLLAAVGVLIAGLVLYVAWRLEPSADKAWLSTTLVVAGFYGTTDAGASLVLASDPTAWVRMPLLELVLLTLVAVALWAGSLRCFPRGWNPFALAVAVHLLAVAVRARVPAGDPGPELTPGDGPVLVVLAVAAGSLATLVAVAAVRLHRLPATARAAVVGLVVTGALADGIARLHDFDEPHRWRVGAVVCVLACAGVLVAAMVDFLLGTERRVREKLAVATLRARRAEVAHDHEEERLHELRATAAGVASASRLLVDPAVLIPAPRRQLLAEMLASESERLSRLTAPSRAHQIGRVSLDAVVGPLVARQRALGQVVSWRPSGVVVLGDHDELVEIVDVLLVNAHLHAPGAAVSVEAVDDWDGVTVRVTDDGPGLDPLSAPRLCERGYRGGGSSGSGLGLYLADRLARGMGGRLIMGPADHSSGACFTVLLRRPEGSAGGVRDALLAPHAG